MNKTDGAIQHCEVSREIMLRNSAMIENLDFKHLAFIEKHLDYYEKVSLMFLLCAAHPKQRKFILNELIILSNQPSKQTDYLKILAESQIHDKWKYALLESLCLIQAKRIIFELGLNIDELTGRYLPSNLHFSDKVHGTVKRLYKMCANMTVTECYALVNYMKKKYPHLENFKYSDNGEYLELHLMHWISENIISLGGQSDGSSEGFQRSNLQPLIQYFRLKELDELEKTISNTPIQKCNQASVSKPANESQTDDNRNTVSHERPKSIESINLHDMSLGNYRIRRNKAGILLIINQQTFNRETDLSLQEYLPDKDLEVRTGTDQDEIRLKIVFKALNYKVKVKANLTHSQIFEEIDKVVDECKKYDSIFICVLSHGCDGVVYGTNSIPVEIEAIKHRMISKKLIGKPKVLIIQACQGINTQRAVLINHLATDGNESSKPAYCDLLVCVATVKGFTSMRHTEMGSWYIQTLCEKIIELADQMHFMDILTVVHREVQAKRGRYNECMVPELCSSLGHSLYLPKIDRALISTFGELKGN